MGWYTGDVIFVVGQRAVAQTPSFTGFHAFSGDARSAARAGDHFLSITSVIPRSRFRRNDAAFPPTTVMTFRFLR